MFSKDLTVLPAYPVFIRYHGCIVTLYCIVAL